MGPNASIEDRHPVSNRRQNTRPGLGSASAQPQQAPVTKRVASNCLLPQ
jgi:hypothetical protein